MNKIMPFLFLFNFALAKNLVEYAGEYTFRHSLYLTSEDRVIHDVEDFVRIQIVSAKKANILVQTYTQNYHSCQLIGEAELMGDTFIFKSSINKKTNRGKTAECILKLIPSTNDRGEKIIKVTDDNNTCKLRYCGMTAELDGEFKQKSVEVPEKF
jgi:hypothetical protein